MRYYVIFSNSDQPRWWMRFFKDGFQHCALLQECEPGLYHYIENLYYWMHVSIGSVDLDALALDYTVIEYIVPDDKPINTRPIIPEPITCVTVIKKILGIRNNLVQSPYQLYRYLKEE